MMVLQQRQRRRRRRRGRSVSDDAAALIRLQAFRCSGELQRHVRSMQAASQPDDKTQSGEPTRKRGATTEAQSKSTTTWLRTPKTTTQRRRRLRPSCSTTMRLPRKPSLAGPAATTLRKGNGREWKERGKESLFGRNKKQKSEENSLTCRRKGKGNQEEKCSR